MDLHDVVSWTALILGYAENSRPELALQLFLHMETLANAPTFAGAVKACSFLALKEEGKLVGMDNRGTVRIRALEKAMAIHSQAASSGYLSDIFLQSSLVDLYGKCGSMLDARLVFDRMQHRDVVSWNSLILGYVENGETHLVFDLLARLTEDFAPNDTSFVAAIKACATLATTHDGNGRPLKGEALERGTSIHAQARDRGFEKDKFVTSTLIDMYAKCGALEDARRVLERARPRDSVPWTVLMLGYVDNGEERLALDLFAAIFGSSSAQTSSPAFVAALKACIGLAARESTDAKVAKLESLEKCMEIHREAARCEVELDITLESTLVDAYSKCGSLLDARMVFDRMEAHSTVSWTVMLNGCTENGDEEMALDLFESLELQLQLEPNSVTFVAVLKACAAAAAKEAGKEIDDDKFVKLRSLDKAMAIHSRARAKFGGGGELDLVVANTVVDLYAKCGSMASARGVFDATKLHSAASCASLVRGYAENNEGELALELFWRIKERFLAVEGGAGFVAALKACSSLVDLRGCRAIHGEISRHGLLIVVESCLVDAYGKCGSTIDARRCFEAVARRRLIDWNALMAAHSRQGDWRAVAELFHGMRDEELAPDAVSCLRVLTALSHAGMVELGHGFLGAMETKYGLRPGVEHYTCTVDMLARANRLDAAVAAVRGMPYEADTATWTAVMAACCRWKNAAVAEVAFGALRAIDPGDGAAFLLMANLYGSLGMWEEQSRIEELGRSCGAPRRSGRSWWIDDKTGILHRFGAGDVGRGGPAIAAKLAEMRGWMMGGDVGGIAHNIGEEDKRGFVLCSHSERIAMACALVSSPPGATIRIGKNLRVCGDCHAVSAVASRMERRRIVCRDARRFHVFEGGKCSCGDYW
ncbi:putative pentatricopeptide repeat-containing protein At3g13770, mitochondrial [Selaginella moellendorffii]|uniref:putative pentatricopeptide repeat-containing protein At3g13770, mitochondrial n=1 Tax=Selaginella moellendorffii TaxID=88036 RepID=UPI000D1CE3E5|nr:putative pentatricopeptide repeat-containing protein At3g13770, mitochondrial [Selaginella moellendorffii]|eukprot:XP_002973923.2 putative pentatricopeptide repeat-containing protein At3g13770, mitochondrial [Selaginella moellendorffii]